MSEQDDADVIERAPRPVGLPAAGQLALDRARGVIGTGRRRIVVIAAACALLIAAATLVTVRLADSSRTDLAGLITEVTTVPVSQSATGFPAFFPPGTASPSDPLATPGTPTPVSARPLTQDGKPEVLYIATEYCPFCAVENWPLIVALSRFGQFTGLATSRSPEFEHIAPIDSWTFYGSHYTSPYLAFVPVEQYSNVLVNAKASPDAKTSYRILQRLTPAQRALFAAYDEPGSTPFLDFGNRAVQIGSGAISPQLMTGESWAQLAAALRQPKTALGAALLTEANSLTAELCRLTRDRPAPACPAFLR